MSEPKTYWERRCNINEKVMDEVFRALAPTLPSLVETRIADIYSQWDKVIKELDEEFKK